MATMKVVSLRRFGKAEGNFEVVDVPVPFVKKGEVKVKLAAAAFNPVDFKMREGNFGGDLPLILGGDASGVVEEVGEGVTQFKKGDEVMLFPFGSGKSNGSYAEYMTISEHLVGKRPKNVSLVEAAAIPLVGLTVNEAVMRRTNVKKGDAVFVAGASGGTGSMAVQFLKIAGADPIIATAGSDDSEEYLCSHLGLKKENIIRYKDKSVDEISATIKHLTHGEGVKHAFDLVGGDMKLACIASLALKGRVITIVEESDPKFPTPLYPSQNQKYSFFMKDADFATVFVGAAAFFGKPDSWKVYNEDLLYIARLFETDQLKLPQITNVGHLSTESVVKAHQMLEKGATKGKIIMEIP
jgi:NADPH2:quinone reductase